MNWRDLAPGLGYTKFVVGPTPAGWLHVFRIDPQQYRLDTLLAKDFGTKVATAREMATKSQALLAINGGFFSPEFEPLGLRIHAGKQQAPLKGTSWWGVFFSQAGTPQIAARSAFVWNPAIEMAVQSGPRLVVDGTIPALKSGLAERSAIGITRDGHVVIVVTERLPIETHQLAELFRRPTNEGGLDCPNAINLDGGGSSQLFAKLRGFTLDVPGFTAVTDVVAVFPR